MQTFYTIDEVAEILRVSPYTVRVMIGKHEIEHYRFGRLIRISDDAVCEYLEKCRRD